VCTISGYLEKAFAEEGLLGGASIIDTTVAGGGGTTTPGFGLLRNPNALVVVSDDGQNINTVGSTTAAQGGYAQDLVGNTKINPLGQTGLKYCHCVAVVDHGCDPGDSNYGGVEGANAAFLTAGTATILEYGLATGMTTAAAGGAKSNTSPLFPEYNALSVQFAQAMARSGVVTEVSNEDEKATIMAIAKGLTSKLDKCVPTAITIETNKQA
jgi:hypothetical protein